MRMGMGLRRKRLGIPRVVPLVLLWWLLLLEKPSFVQAQDCLEDGACDKHERCPVWRQEGECLLNKEYMETHCPASCQEEWKQQQEERKTTKKVGDSCQDLHERCSLWAQVGECQENASVMRKYCGRSCGFCGPIAEARAKAAAEAKAKAAAEKRAKRKAGGGDSDDEDEDDEDEGDEDFESEDEETEEEGEEKCRDAEEACTYWASAGECEKNPAYMLKFCPVSCDTCDQVLANKSKKKRPKQNEVGGAEALLSKGDRALIKETEAFGEAQAAEGSKVSDTLARIQESVAYMKDEKTQSLPKSILDVCQNRHRLCAFWATLGECEKNRAYMTTNCAPSCSSCHLINFEARCPKLVNPLPALRPGDLNKMFERIVQEAPGNRTLTVEERRLLAESNMTEYTVVVHSRPSETPLQETSISNDKSLPPWVITFENFLTPEECEALIQLGHKYEYKRSEDVGKRKFDGTHDSVKSERRTSENAWCSDREGCRSEEVPMRVHERMSQVMGIPANNSEDFQMLRYETGQFYRTHHDYIPHQVDRQCGPRILTFFLYLSDVDGGGGTNFPNLNITVNPKMGRALLWPSVLNANPMQKDGRTMHQAMDVESGTKFAANGWIHMYDYVTSQKNGCN